jgi:hypothetical protein
MIVFTIKSCEHYYLNVGIFSMDLIWHSFKVANVELTPNYLRIDTQRNFNSQYLHN